MDILLGLLLEWITGIIFDPFFWGVMLVVVIFSISGFIKMWLFPKDIQY